MDAEPYRCSFCKKQENDVHKLIAGPGVFICDECIEVCNHIISGKYDGRPESDDIAPVAWLQRMTACPTCGHLSPLREPEA